MTQNRQPTAYRSQHREYVDTVLSPSMPATRAERSDRTHELLSRAHTCEDPAEREHLLDEVILINRGVAQAVASRYRDRGVAQDDLEQAALEGLVKAVHKFDPTVRDDLLTYAVPTMRGEVQRWFRDHGWMVRPPRRVQELQWRVSRSLQELSQELGREPTSAEIQVDVDCSPEQMDEALRGFGAFAPASLDAPNKGAEDLTLGDALPDSRDDGTRAAEARAVLGPVVRRLSERDRHIVYLSFFEQRSQSQIGADLGVTQMQVSRLLKRIMRTLRDQLEDSETPGA